MSDSSDIAAIYVDLGTTNTRVWFVQQDRIIARARTAFGVRDCARAGSTHELRAVLRRLISEVRSAVPPNVQPEAVVAGGMISSSLGLEEIPHTVAPAGADEIATASKWGQYLDVTDLPVLLVAGVRCGPSLIEASQVSATDVMRGEESQCIGLAALGQPCPMVVLSLGSHWKAIQVNSTGAIASSITSLSGEMIHAAQVRTVLAGSLPPEPPASLDPEWVARGMAEQRRSGLPRALFCVRLLDLNRQGTPEQRFAYLGGCFIAAEFDSLSKAQAFRQDMPVLVIGPAALATAWEAVLAEAGIAAKVLSEAEREDALLAGLRCILLRAQGRG